MDAFRYGGAGFAGRGQAAGEAAGPGGAPAPARPPASAVAGLKRSGLDFADEAVEEAEKAKETVRNVGSRTFYQRDGRWVDSQVTEEQEKDFIRVKQFSDEYFDLARTYGKRMSQYMVFDEPVLLTLDKQAYLIEP
jgi:hypothetical protein